MAMGTDTDPVVTRRQLSRPMNVGLGLNRLEWSLLITGTCVQAVSVASVRQFDRGSCASHTTDNWEELRQQTHHR